MQGLPVQTPPAALALVMLASSGAIRPAALRAQLKPHFAGTVEIAGQPADPGTVVEIVVFRADAKYTPCADARVKQESPQAFDAPARLVSGYDARLEPTPDCLNPDNEYAFYVNGVWAANRKFPFSQSSQLSYVNLVVDKVALATDSTQGGIRLVWFYGTVHDKFQRPAAPGTKVTVEARGASCKGSGTTRDLYWVPKYPNSATVGAKGFFVVGVETLAGCVDRVVGFDIYAGEEKLQAAVRQVTTPPYGGAVQVNLTLP
jgi:hypothetical protein